MKNFLSLTVPVIAFFIGIAAAQAQTVEHCTPENKYTAGFNYIEVLVDDRGDHSLAIEWNRPFGREDVQEVAAEYFDDMAMHGYLASGIDATLSFYSEDDYDGKRIEFILNGRNVPVFCTEKKD